MFLDLERIAKVMPVPEGSRNPRARATRGGRRLATADPRSVVDARSERKNAVIVPRLVRQQKPAPAARADVDADVGETPHEERYGVDRLNGTALLTPLGHQEDKHVRRVFFDLA